jgi:hypothetical protein
LVKGKVAEAFVIASEIADAGDWEFDGLYGWRNRDPELPEKVFAIMAKYPKALYRPDGASSDESAQAIAVARA